MGEHSPVQGQQRVTTLKETSNSIAKKLMSGVGDALSAVGGLFDIQPSNEAEEPPEQQSESDAEQR